jgi:hypothetical protein
MAFPFPATGGNYDTSKSITYQDNDNYSLLVIEPTSQYIEKP